MKRFTLMALLLLPLLGVAQLIEVGRFEGEILDMRQQLTNYSKNSFLTYEDIGNDSTVVRCYRREFSKWHKTMELSLHRVYLMETFSLNGDVLVIGANLDTEYGYNLYDSLGYLKTLKGRHRGQVRFFDFATGHVQINGRYDETTREFYISVVGFNEQSDVELLELEEGRLFNYGQPKVRLKDVAFFYESGKATPFLWAVSPWSTPVKLNPCENCLMTLLGATDSFVTGYTGKEVFKSDGTVDGTTFIPFNKDANFIASAGEWMIYKTKVGQGGSDIALRAYNIFTDVTYEMISSKNATEVPTNIFNDDNFYTDGTHIFWRASTTTMDVYQWDLSTPRNPIHLENSYSFYMAQSLDGCYGIEWNKTAVSIHDYQLGDSRWIPFFSTIGTPRYIDFYDDSRSSLFITTDRGRIYELDHTVEAEAPVMPSFSMYPNPASEQVRIESPNTIAAIRIYSLSGKELLHISNVDSKSLNIDLSPFQGGVYIVKVEGAEYTSTERLIIE